MSDEQRPADEAPEDDEVITLEDEEGNQHKFTIGQVITVDEKDYAILMPLDGEEGNEEDVILRIDQENGEDFLVEIEDEAEFERVAEVWEDMLDDEEDEDSPPIDG